jgi:septal ring factor EnvC (AmiA/AmiB activator)
MYEEGGYPQASRLVDVLAAVSENFSRVYIVIDALDESAKREKLLAVLLQILENKMLDHIQLLVTSRKELDIERALLAVAESLSLSNHYVDKDIRTYIKSRLQNDSKYYRWPNVLKAETETALVKGAKGT